MFTFNNKKVPFLKALKGRQRKTYAPRYHDLLRIPGRPGAEKTKTTVDVVYHDVPVGFQASEEEFSNYKKELRLWLLHEEPKELIFSDEPDKLWYAEIEGDLDFTRNGELYEGVLRFLCADPHEYSRFVKEEEFADGVAVATNQGEAPVSPVFEFDVLEDISHLDVITEKAYMRLGEPAPIDEPPYERQTLILSDSLTSMVGWTDASELDNGYAVGTMSATPSGFKATDFGSVVTPHKWQGPAKRKSFSQPIQNFRIDLEVELLNVTKQTGMIEIYCKDAQGNTVAKVGVEDVWSSLAQVQAKFQLGNVQNRNHSNQYYRKADYPAAWNNYKGMLRLYRDGNRFRPYFALVQPNGKHVWVSQAYLYTDVANNYDAPIVEIVLAIRKFPNTTEANMTLRNLKVWRLNDQPEGIPMIAKAGDKIIINHSDFIHEQDFAPIRINGEDRKDLKDFGSSFFQLPIGQTPILIEPAEKVNGKVSFRERSL